MDALDVSCAQLTRDLFAIAKFLVWRWQWRQRVRRLVRGNQPHRSVLLAARLPRWRQR